MSVEQQEYVQQNDNIVEISQHPTDINVSTLNDPLSKVEYSQLCDVTSELVRCVINDREKSRNASHFLTTWVSRLRLKDAYSTIFTSVRAPKAKAHQALEDKT